MMAMIGRLSLPVLVMAMVPLQEAQAQADRFQGAWLEEGVPCASVFVATPKAVSFRRPASAFAPAFIVAGQRLSTPLATCRIVSLSTSGQRQIVNLRCTTTISTDSAQAILAMAEDGGLYRFNALEAGIATKYQRCNRDVLKAP
ncbi:hypothetical protein [Bosea sp. 124]|uniref:hypothetical protein n=1 Tax=Bosea sp. 124 TaxID=2135642 RepID=UPI000D3909E5|nr:hypothetical protein [Bosea sp. 124]PTM42849.1 hypothetical protein C8D03_4449 [Bosea sp. 124]